MFTKGDWKYAEKSGLIFAEGKGIAKVYDAGRLMRDYTTEGASNARLIAYAPEMFEVLEQARASLRLPGVEAHKVADRIDKLLADITRTSDPGKETE